MASFSLQRENFNLEDYGTSGWMKKIILKTCLNFYNFSPYDVKTFLERKKKMNRGRWLHDLPSQSLYQLKLSTIVHCCWCSYGSSVVSCRRTITINGIFLETSIVAI